MVGASYPFLDVMWTMLVFFLWVLWFWLLFTVFADVFRRHDISGWGKTAWLIFVIILPFLGVFVYLIAESKGMAERNIERANQAQVAVRRLREADGGRKRNGDRQGQGATRLGRDHAGRVRLNQAEGARVA